MDEIELEKYRRAADKCWERGSLKLDPKKQQVEQINSEVNVKAWQRKIDREERERSEVKNG
jgi:hypothetical protein